jgi:hypothetical protein
MKNFSNKQRLVRILKPIVESIINEVDNQLDKDAANELIMYAENDRRLYDVLHNTYLPALLKFKKKGTFDRVKAIKLLEYYYQNYVRAAYKKEFGDDIRLNPISRKYFSEQFLDSLESDGYL